MLLAAHADPALLLISPAPAVGRDGHTSYQHAGTKADFAARPADGYDSK